MTYVQTSYPCISPSEVNVVPRSEWETIHLSKSCPWSRTIAANCRITTDIRDIIVGCMNSPHRYEEPNYQSSCYHDSLHQKPPKHLLDKVPVQNDLGTMLAKIVPDNLEAP